MSRAALHTQSGAGNYPVGGGWGPSSFLNIQHLQEVGRSPASEVGHCLTSPRLWGSHCAQPSCWCIDTPRSHLVVVVIVLSLRAGALTPRMMVRLVCLSGWRGAGQALCDVSASQRRDAPCCCRNVCWVLVWTLVICMIVRHALMRVIRRGAGPSCCLVITEAESGEARSPPWG